MYKILITFFLLFFLTSLNASNDLKKVTLQLSWFDQFQFAGYYIAKEKGFYKELGLDVEILPFEFGVETSTGVSEGKYDFSIGRETLLVEKASGKDIVALYALFQASPLVLLTTKESQIDSVDKFKNKTIMTTINDASEVSLKAMITSKKLSINELSFIKHSHDINDLIDKKTDVISAYISKSPYTLQKKNIKYNVFSPKNFGFDMYSDFLITSNKLIENEFELVQNMKKASLKGWNYAYNNIEEAADLIITKYNGQFLSKEEIIYEANELKKLSYFNTYELGNINKEKIQRIHDLYNIMGILPKKINIDMFLYNESNFYNSLSFEEKRFIRKNPVLTVSKNLNIMPLSFFNDIGLQVGIVQDYLDIVSEKTGLRFIPQTNLKSNIDTNIDLFGLPLSNSRKKLKTISYFKLEDATFKLKKKNLESILNIGVFNIFYSEKRLKYIKSTYPNTNFKEYDSIENLVTDLRENRLDLIFAPEELILSFLKYSDIHDIEYTTSKIKSETIPLYLSLNLGNKTFNKILSKAINDISIEQHNAIRSKWIPLLVDTKLDWTLLLQILFFIFLVFFVLIYKQSSLKKVNNKLSESHKEIEKANEALRELSELDHLTKLYNRRYFENVIKDILSIEKREKNYTSFLMLDIDDFKRINDTYGHKVGDDVLVDVSNILTNLCRKSDLLSRIGGEEFVILLPNTTIDGAKIHSENIRTSLQNLVISVDDFEIKITVSMGLTSFKENDTLDSVFKRADDGLFKAKRSGKNRLIIM